MGPVSETKKSKDLLSSSLAPTSWLGLHVMIDLSVTLGIKGSFSGLDGDWLFGRVAVR
jgi:hypothetical protein